MTNNKSFQEEAEICYTDDMAKGVTTGTRTKQLEKKLAEYIGGK